MHKMKLFAIRNIGDYAQILTGIIREPLLLLDADLRVVSANPAFHHTFQTSDTETKNRLIYELADGHWNIPELKDSLEAIRTDAIELADLPIDHTFPGVGRLILRVNGRRIDQEGDGSYLILLAIEDAAKSGKEEGVQPASEIEYRRLVETINSIIIVIDAKGEIRFFNRFSESLFGYSREEVLGRPFVGTILPEKSGDGEDNRGLIDEIREDPDRFYINESMGLTKTGEEVWFSWSARERRDEDGRIVEILIDGNDITSEYKQRERADVAYRVINNSPDLIVRLDSMKHYVFVNRKFAELAGVHQEEFYGKKICEISLPVESTAKVEEVIEEAALSRSDITFETSYGSRSYMVTVTPELDTGNHIAHFDFYARDISRRKQAEEDLRREQEKLRHSEERFRSVLENSLDVTYRRNLQTGSCDYISPAIEMITGLTPEEFSSLTMEEVRERLHPDDLERVDKQFNAIIKNRILSGILEYRFRAKNGMYVWMGDNFSIIHDDDTGEPLYRVGIVRDISDTKKMEDELRRAWNTAEKKMREAEEKQGILEAVFDNVPEGFVIFNNETGKVELVSRHLAEFADLKRRDLHNLSISEYAKLLEVSSTRGEPVALERMPIWRTMYKGELVINERYRLKNFNGETITVLINTAPVRDAEGKIIRSIASWRNIEPMKQAEIELRASRDAARKAMRKAEERERILKTILVNIPEGITIVEAPDGKLQLVSTYHEKVIGIPARKLFRMSLAERLDLLKNFRPYGDVESAEKEDFPICRALHKGEVIINEEWILDKKNGSTMVVSIIAAPVHDDQGRITHAVTSWRDITNNKEMEAELRRNEYELRTLVESSPDLILRFDERMRYVFVNATFEHMTGIERDRLIGRTNKELGMPEDKCGAWESDLEKVFHSGRERNIEFSFWGLFGKRHFWGRLIPEFDRIGRVETVMMVARDITERKQAEEHIRYLSFHDSVTGLYNRAYFEEEVRRLDSRRLLPVSFIMGDVNNLKLTNDVFGHHEGDRVLQTIADILRETCRDEDIIARWGGDEFVVILPDTDVETAQAICSRIRETAKNSSQTVILPSIALGTAAKTDAEQNIYRIIMKAEAHMYDNKLAESRENQGLVISSLLAGVRKKWPEADQHVARALALAHSFGKTLKLSERQMESLDQIIRLHDIGKAIIPDDLLRKPGRLSYQEWEIVKRHPEAGYRIVKTFDETAGISAEILAQRERWDGSGYPRGLKDRQIPYLTRIATILDVYDVITHDRPYERTFSSREAIDILRRDAGRYFDPDLVEPFVSIISG